MENILRYPTKTAPFVSTDYIQGQVLISGISIPENSPQFYSEIHHWIISFIENEKRTLSIHLDFEYFNNSSSLCITSLLSVIRRRVNPQVQLFWHFSIDDEDLEEDGEDFADTSKLPFKMIPFDDENSYNCEATDRSPLIYFDTIGDFILKGNCTVENPLLFFQPAIKWLNAHRLTNSPTNINFEFTIDQIDDKNTPYIKAIIALLEIYQNKGVKTTVNWKYNNILVEELGISILKDCSLHYFFKQTV